MQSIETHSEIRLFCDLDHTLIYSHRVPIGLNKIAVEYLNGKEQSFMTQGTIYDILPVSQLLCDILTVFSRDYVVSGPVWEYYSSNNDEWAIGLKRELKYDVLNGFVGKTVIHPNQIPVVVDSLKVKKQDYDDAMEILSWRDDSALLVGGSAQKERMNEVNTHLRWAKRVASLAAVYGVQND